MENLPGKIWFDGSNEISADLQKLKSSIENLGEHYTGMISLYPGLTAVELIDQGSDFVTIKTNEGVMKRTNIQKKIEPDKVILEFDEEYQAGKMVTSNSHFKEEFITNNDSLTYHLIISNTKAPGFMGFLFRTFGSSNTGKAFLESCKDYLESN